MPRPLYNTTQLPKQLRDELGLKEPGGADKNGRRNGNVSRKDRRKAERNQKKAPRGRSEWARRGAQNDSDESDDGEVRPGARGSAKQAAKAKPPPPKSILKKPKPVEESEESEDEDDGMSDLLNEDDDDEEDFDEDQDEDSASATKPRVSRAVKDKLAEDDAEIAALEKKLGIKGKKKLPKSFQEDGLDELLGDLGGFDSGDETKKRKREGDEWLQRKRLKAQAALGNKKSKGEIDSESEEEEEEEEEGDFDDENGVSGSDDSDEGSEGEGEDDEFEGFDDEVEDEDGEVENDEPPEKPKQKENPYVAPVAASEAAPRKYIPPSLRAQSTSESESLTRLRRQTQGHLNKLSEANLVSILRDIEKLYQDYPRHNVTSTLIDLLINMVYDRSVLQDTFIILHAGFVAAVYKVMGMDFGAEFIQRVVEKFDEDYEAKDTGKGKEMANAISLLSHLYNFHVIGSSLVFDYIRLFLKEINELNTELLLKIIKNSGPQLRQDDPSSLKDIILLIQPAVAQVGEAALSVRTKFMIETMTDLKNNRMKTGAVASAISSEHITRMKKILGSLNTRTLRASEPLRIGRMDIHNSSKKGKWWLVGASWKEDPLADAASGVDNKISLADTLDVAVDGDEVDLGQLARAHRMNTDVRRSIFVAIMSAADYRDAHVRLSKLRLKRSQEGEIPRVLLHCAAEEEAHNPYYTLIARKLCGERKIKMAFMFSLWDVFKRMGERGDLDEDDMDPDDDDNALTTKAVVNLAKMFGSLVADGALTLGILKVLDFAYLQPKTKTFVELLLITTMLQTQQKKLRQKQKEREQSASKKGGDGQVDDADEFDEKALADVFLRTRETPQIVPRLVYFIRKVVAKSDVVASKREKRIVKWGSRVALDTLKVISRAGAAA
ncbi:suppressor of glycerol defect [Emmonsiellopsis sp. PD_33]|nr:suppressor of glycerol defect [Emmonsiellopsis sp. PD_33]